MPFPANQPLRDEPLNGDGSSSSSRPEAHDQTPQAHRQFTNPPWCLPLHLHLGRLRDQDNGSGKVVKAGPLRRLTLPPAPLPLAIK